MSPSALRRYRAERLLRKEFLGLRSKVLAIVRSQLRSKNVALDGADLEACYAQAWHGLYAAVLGGEEVESPSAWLVTVTFRRAIDESRSSGRHALGGERGVTTAFDPDLAGQLDDRARLRQVFEGLRTGLSERECEAASLCYLHGLSRAEAAGRMGISEARMRKLMEGTGAGKPGVASKVGAMLDTIKGGGWCEQQSSLMRAFAFGVLEPGGERYLLAVVHCRECPACRAQVASLRGLAAVLPLPLLSPLALTGGGTVGTVSRARGAGARAAGSTRAGRASAEVGRSAGRAGMGAGGGVSGAGWSGLAGSLTAKLAITAILTLGAGYAVLGSRAHGSSPATPPATHAAASPQPLSSETLSQVLFPALGTPAHRGRSIRRPSTARTYSSRAAHPADAAIAREFGPERVQREARAASPSPGLVPPRPARVVHEFGIE